LSSEREISITRISEDLEVFGYVLDRENLSRINIMATEAVKSGDERQNSAIAFSASVSCKDHREFSFNSIEQVISYLEVSTEIHVRLELNYHIKDHAAIELSFDKNGFINIIGYGAVENNFEFGVNRLKREIMACDPCYPRIIKWFTHSRALVSALTSMIVLASFYLFICAGYYIYAGSVGVNIDPKAIPVGNEYYNDVEKALKSDSIEVKIDTLLRGELRNFTNVTDILDRQKKLVFNISIYLVFMAVVFLIRRIFRTIYPKAFFSFGPSVRTLQRLQRKREMWIVGVVVAFIVNILTGLILGLAF